MLPIALLWLSIGTLPIAEPTVITPCSNRVLPQSHNDQSKSPPHVLLIKEDEGLLTISSPDYRVTGEFADGEDALDVDFHLGLNLLVWSTRSGRIYTTGLAESRLTRCVPRARLYHSEERWLPASIAVDYVAERLYVLDTRSNSVRLMELAGKGTSVLGVGVRGFKPAQVDVDAAEGWLFLMDHGEIGRERSDHVVRMRVDGGEPRVIDPPALGRESIIAGMALDRVNKRIVVSSVLQRRIFAMDYEGRGSRTLVAQDGAIGISVTRDHLFWINAFGYHNGTSAYVDGGAYRCRYSPELGCEANSTRRLDEGGVVLGVLAVEPKSQRAPVGELCGRCSGFCYGYPGGGSCGCGVGWRLENGTECRRVRDFLVFEDAGVLRGACLEGNGAANGCQTIVPSLLPELNFKVAERTGFDYDPTKRKLYYGGKDAIYRMDVDTGSRIQLLYQKDVFFGPLAVDRTSKNLYYTEIEQRSNVSFYIMKVMSVRSDSDTDAKLLAQTSSSILWEFGGVHTILPYTYRGYVFVTIFDNTKRRYQMLRMQTDAKNATILLGLENSTFASVDIPDDRLYTLNSNNSDIRSSNLDGRDVKVICSAKSLGSTLSGFLVHDKFIYVQNRTSLRKFDKTSGEDLGEVDLSPYGSRMAAGLKIHESEEANRNDLSRHPCAEDNGGCDNFCFAVPRSNGSELARVCRCFDGVRCRGRV